MGPWRLIKTIFLLIGSLVEWGVDEVERGKQAAAKEHEIAMAELANDLTKRKQKATDVASALARLQASQP